MTSHFAALTLMFGFLLFAQAARQDRGGAWLDAPGQWNFSAASLVAEAPEGPNPRCDPTLRAAQTASDRLLTASGWKLLLPRESRLVGGRTIEIVQAFLRYDGMCRPLQFQAFVFVDERLVGALSPHLMNAREDGQLAAVRISEAGEITATFLRYEATDALCCPSRESTAVYAVSRDGGTYALKLVRVETTKRPQPR